MCNGCAYIEMSILCKNVQRAQSTLNSRKRAVWIKLQCNQCPLKSIDQLSSVMSASRSSGICISINHPHHRKHLLMSGWQSLLQFRILRINRLCCTRNIAVGQGVWFKIKIYAANGPQQSEGNDISGKVETAPMQFENMKFAQTSRQFKLLWLLCKDIAGHCVCNSKYGQNHSGSIGRGVGGGGPASSKRVVDSQLGMLPPVSASGKVHAAATGAAGRCACTLRATSSTHAAGRRGFGAKTSKGATAAALQRSGLSLNREAEGRCSRLNAALQCALSLYHIMG